MPSDPGSFRDPSGSIFRKNGKIYRSIYKAGVRDFEAAQASGVYDQLIKSGILFPFQLIDTPEFAPDATIHCLSHPRLPMISYPWEWPFSLLKEAALIHLEAMEQLIPLGFWLRDASAFNVQYSGKRLCLIDTCLWTILLTFSSSLGHGCLLRCPHPFTMAELHGWFSVGYGN